MQITAPPQPAESAEQTGKKSNENSYLYDFWKSATRDAITVYTFFLALFTAVLSGTAFVQIRYLRRADETARTTANAAKKSADVAEAALTVAGRPYLVPKEPKIAIWRTGQPGMPVTMTNPAEYKGIVEYGFRNMGRTVALLKEVTICLMFAETLPVMPDYRAGMEAKNNSDTRALVGHFPIGRDSLYECPAWALGTGKRIDAATYNRSHIGELKVFLYGYIRYSDLFDYLHTEGFCFRFLKITSDKAASECSIVAGDNYNYRRREKIPPEGFETIPPQGAELTFEDIAKANAKIRGDDKLG